MRIILFTIRKEAEADPRRPVSVTGVPTANFGRVSATRLRVAFCKDRLLRLKSDRPQLYLRCGKVRDNDVITQQGIGWRSRVSALCAAWAFLCPTLASAFGSSGLAALVILGVILPLAGAEWVVNGMRLSARWERMACFTGMLALLVLAFMAIASGWALVLPG